MADAEKAATSKDIENSTETTPLVPKPQGMDSQTKELLIIGASTVILIAIGVVSVQIIEGWQPLTAIYIIVQIVTTIGYGDFTVTSDEMKLFCAFYVILMLTFGAYVINILLGWVQSRAMSMARTKLKRIEHKFDRGETVETPREMDHAKHAKDRFEFLFATALAVLAIAFGTVFYAATEACTCSYGHTAIDGCKEDTYELCLETGGYKKSWICSFYMSVITLTTVGFGDHSPRSKLGRSVGIVWMLVGVSFMANWVGRLSTMFFEIQQKRKLRVNSQFSAETFKQLDADGNGGLSRAEFRGYFLVQNGLVQQEDLDCIDAHFYRLVNGRSTTSPPLLTWEMVKNCPSCNH